MKVSEAIKKLTEILATEGDLEVVQVSEIDDFFGLNYSFKFEVIGIPNVDESAETKHVGIMDGKSFDDGPDKHALRLIK